MTGSSTTLPDALVGLLLGLGIDPADARLQRRRSPEGNDFLVLPTPDRPQLVVPCIPTAGVMIRERRARGLRAKASKRAVATALGSGCLDRLPVLRLNLRGSALDELLLWITAESAGDFVAPYAAGIMSGPPRANRKPVLRIFSPTGGTWGYAKIGINELTDALVRREAGALAEVSGWGLRKVRPPAVLRAGTYGGHEILATSPLAVSGAERQPSALPVEPTRELFLTQADHNTPLRASPALTAPLAVVTPAAAALEALAERLLAVIGDERIPLGASHGDWTSWNMAWAGSGPEAILEAWDWERLTIGAPQGHDVVHFEAAKVRVDESDSAEDTFLRTLPAKLAACGIDPALSSRLLTTYLVGIGRRYAADLALEDVPALSRRLHWVTDLLAREVSRLECDTPHRISEAPMEGTR